MNSLIFINAIIVGIITLIIGTIVFNLTINKKNKDNEKPFGLHISFFATGFFLHFIVELIGLNQYICDKHCNIKI
jgi:hypothetical protein